MSDEHWDPLAKSIRDKFFKSDEEWMEQQALAVLRQSFDEEVEDD